MKLQHPVTGFVRDVADDRRVQILKARGFVEVADDTPLGANHPYDGPIQRDDTSTAIPNDAVTPVTPQPDAPELDDEPEDERPAKSAPKADWVAYARAQGIEDADELSKADIIERLG